MSSLTSLKQLLDKFNQNKYILKCEIFNLKKKKKYLMLFVLSHQAPCTLSNNLSAWSKLDQKR